jgi:hypothetical protein
MQKHPTLSAIVVMKFDLGLYTKEKEEGLSKVEDVFNMRPNWSMNGNCRVKSGDSKFQHPPQVIVLIV